MELPAQNGVNHSDQEWALNKKFVAEGLDKLEGIALDAENNIVLPAQNGVNHSGQEWTLNKKFITEGLEKLEGIALDVENNIVVSSWELGIKTYNNNGQLVSTIYDAAGATNVVVSAENKYIFNPRLQGVIQVNDKQGKQLLRTEVTNASDEKSTINGLAVDSKGRILVSQVKNAISIHNPDHSVFTKFATEAMPYRIAVSSDGKILSTFYDMSIKRAVSAAVIDYSGNIRPIQPPPEVKLWVPSFVCWGKDEFFVVNSSKGDPRAIYRYKGDGEYLGCVTSQLNRPVGITLSKDMMQLYVAEHNEGTVKIFDRC